jgi:hypothetical protein
MVHPAAVEVVDEHAQFEVGLADFFDHRFITA